MTEQEAKAELDKLFQPLSMITSNAVSAFMNHIEKNKQTFIDAINKCADVDPDISGAKDVKEDSDVALLALSLISAEETLRKYQAFVTVLKITGLAGKGWNYVYNTHSKILSELGKTQH